MSIKAFFDESHDSKRERLIVFASYYAAEQVWADFEQAWCKLLSRHGLTDFHANECEHSRGQFKGWSRSDRDEVQREAIELICSAKVHGVACGLQLTTYNACLAEFKARRRIPRYRKVSGSLGDPFYLAFQFAIERMAVEINDSGIPEEEKVSLVFDQQFDYSACAAEIHCSLRESSKLEFVHRLGRISFDSRRDYVELQAADVLAYELFRFMDGQLGGPRKRDRWQWSELARHIPGCYIIPNEAIQEILSWL